MQPCFHYPLSKPKLMIAYILLQPALPVQCKVSPLCFEFLPSTLLSCVFPYPLCPYNKQHLLDWSILNQHNWWHACTFELWLVSKSKTPIFIEGILKGMFCIQHWSEGSMLWQQFVQEWFEQSCLFSTSAFYSNDLTCSLAPVVLSSLMHSLSCAGNNFV